MIRSFRSKALRLFVEKSDPSRLSVSNVRRLEAIIAALDNAARPEELNISGWRFHALKGAMKGRYAVDASGNWRVTFGWEGSHATDVDLEDYH